MRIALCQMKVVTNKHNNLNKAYTMIVDAVENDADIIVLPEMFNCPYSSDYFIEYAEPRESGTYLELSKWAKEFGVIIIGGSIPEVATIEGEDKIYNTSYAFDSDGKCLGAHRKAHLFDINIPNGIKFFESDVLTPGSSHTMIDTAFGKIGLAICYDIRFPEFFRKMTLDGAELIIVPAAFNMTTGPAHWVLTARARALDNQLFVALCSPSRDESGVYTAYGHSMVTNPWGEVEDKLDENEGILLVDVELSKCKEIRTGLPLLEHRRPELYV